MKKKTKLPALSGLCLALILALLPGCDTGQPGTKGNNGANQSGTGGDTTVTPVVNVQVYMENGTQYDGKGTVKIPYKWENHVPSYLPVDGGTVSGGKLTLTLPATVADQYLEPFPADSGVTVSPADIKGLWLEGFDLVDGDTIYEVIKFGDYKGIFYLYASKAGAVTGTEKDGGSTMTYSLTLKQGWNEVYYHSEQQETGGRISSMTTDLSNVPADMKWVLHPVE
jgi:hypothetical protein